MEINRVVVVGATGVGKKRLAARMTQHRDVGKWDEEESGSGNVQVWRCPPWTLSNRYYDAEMLVEVVVDDGDGSALERVTAASEDAKCQALMLVFDESSSDTFDPIVVDWEPFIEEQQPEVLMCVCVRRHEAKTPSEVSEAAALRERASEWCVDNQIEFVRVDATKWTDDGDDDDDDDASGSPDKTVRPGLLQADDLDGVDRIVQALHSTMWEHMTMKPRSQVGQQQQQQRQVGAQEEQGKEEEEEDEDDDDGDDEDGDDEDNGISVQQQQQSDSQQKRKKRKKKKKKKKKKNKPEATAAASAAASDSAVEDELFGANPITDQDSMDFAAILQQIQRVRAEAPSLPMEERRRRAEAAIMNLIRFTHADPDAEDGADGDGGDEAADQALVAEIVREVHSSQRDIDRQQDNNK
eukprot:TRINITY_DN66614_c7_g2_i1.p1 TRINITY_DN66614_c7_g2~~TRINITY_DN66614_c7_g2_i1.p1  ORF type:complete len:411 (-),score=232.38 TRINITY_DN66614_c7_g2_i1:8-1240(-)